MDFVSYFHYSNINFNQSAQAINFTSYVHIKLKTLNVSFRIILCSSSISHGKAGSSLCLIFSYKPHVFVTHILIGCSYRWLHPVVTVTM